MIPEYIICHHTGGSDLDPLMDSSSFTFNQCNELHKQNFNFKSSLGFYIGYQYFIEKGGKIIQGRADTEEGAHTIGMNSKSIGICLAGNFDLTLPTEAQVSALRSLLESKMVLYSIPPHKIVPHRTFASKTCYGRRLTDDWARSLVSKEKLTLIQRIAELKLAILKLLKLK